MTVLPTAILKLAPLLLSLRLVVATLPNGDVSRAMFDETPEGVRATVERTSAQTGVKTLTRVLVPRGRYGWRIDEERRSVIMAAEGHETGVVGRVFVLSGWVDATPDPTVAPHPTQAFEFYAPTHEAAVALRERLKKALVGRR